MSAQSDVWERRRAEFPLLAGAVERHLAWAWDFTEAGDLDAALDAFEDARAAAAEMCRTAPEPTSWS
jgi:hypothetical protein